MSESGTPEDPPPQIRAYYKLEFPGAGNGQGRDYYFQTLSVTIGRRPLPPAPRSPSSSVQPVQPQPSVDVHLGALKSVSRLHAKIEYDESVGCFVFFVHGRNGAWVDDVWVGKGGSMPLRQRTKIQIANRTFYFHLPPSPISELGQGETAPAASNSGSPAVDVMSLTPPPGSPSPSPPASSPSPSPEIKEEYEVKQEYDPDPMIPPGAPPADPPEKPPHTYAMLCYRALKALNGRATLTEICEWIMANFEWYRVNRMSGWQTSLRHNLSMNHAFVKSARGKDERGKGCFWALHPGAAQIFENPAGPSKGNRLNPYAPPTAPGRSHARLLGSSSSSTRSTSSTPLPSTGPHPSSYPAPPGAGISAPSGPINIPSNVSLPIVIAPLPPSSIPATSSSPHLDAPPIVLHSGTLVLNPTIFSHLSQEQLRDLEKLGAQQALSILQAYIVEYLKERMRGERSSRGKVKGKGRGRRKEGKTDASEREAASGAANGERSFSASPAVGEATTISAPQTVASLLSGPPPPAILPTPASDPNPQLPFPSEALAALAAAAASQSAT